MKKIYMTFGVLIMTAAVGFAQPGVYQNQPTKAKLMKDDASAPAIKNTTNNDKAPGDIIWSEDFTGGIPAGWTLVDNNAMGYDWVLNNAPIDNTGAGGFTNTGVLASTSGGNHMLLFGDNYNTPLPASPVDMNAYFQTAAIPITGQPAVSLRFQHKFRLCCQSTAELNVLVSTDPTFASNVLTLDARGAVAINAQSADPEMTSFNISSIAGGLNGNIYIRFHWAVGASHYYWMVDDIEVYETFSNDIIAYNEYYGTAFVPYTRIPVAQIQPIDFTIECDNVGADAQPNTMLTADVNGGTFTGTSTPATLAVGASDSLVCTTQYTPASTVGVPLNVTLTVSSDSTDSTPANNSATFPPFEVSQYIYAQDDHSATPTARGGLDNSTTPPSAEFEAGCFYDVFANDNVSAIDVFIHANTPAGTPIEVALYDISTGSFVQVDRSSIYTTTVADQGTLKTLVLPTTPAVTAGNSYFACVHAYTEFYYGASGQSPDNGPPYNGATCLIFYPNMTAPATGQNYYTTGTPMIRMNFDPAVAVNNVEANEAGFSVYPNPSNDIFNIQLDAETTENVTLSVKNVLGQTVISKNLTVSGLVKETISMSNFDKGSYFVNVQGETINKTTKITVE